MLINFTHIIPKNARLIILFLLIAICRTTARTRNKLAKKDMNEKQVIITAIGQCAGDEGLPVNVVPMDIIRQGRFDYYIDGVVLIREDFDDGFQVKLEVLRCNQGEILETCTSVLNYVNTTDICELLRTPVEAYTDALNRIEPRPLCPLKKGSYFLHHLTTDNSLLKYLPTDDFSFFWKVKISGVKDEQNVMCLNLEFHVSLKRG
ncbi:uncharacterized protein LOC119080787 [Bradysia coprophila]|uniref:uncharacterized protein LOC119080787 n=1 Tax=Bradysia coprophila TaxID=38358 RepID=UPI00187DC484|nr:uncharacterized protein LOC119080787 [Bradysia coprophila]